MEGNMSHWKQWWGGMESVTEDRWWKSQSNQINRWAVAHGWWLSVLMLCGQPANGLWILSLKTTSSNKLTCIPPQLGSTPPQGLLAGGSWYRMAAGLVHVHFTGSLFRGACPLHPCHPAGFHPLGPLHGRWELVLNSCGPSKCPPYQKSPRGVSWWPQRRPTTITMSWHCFLGSPISHFCSLLVPEATPTLSNP